MSVHCGVRLGGRGGMAFDQHIQTLLLAGVRFPPFPPMPVAAAPALVEEMIAAVAPCHADSDARAIRAGNRYRGAFWSLYLLSALAVLCALIPLLLGGQTGWAVAEVALMSLLGALYLRGHRADWLGQWMAHRSQAELAWNLPLVGPLVMPRAPGAPAGWYARVADGALPAPRSEAIDALCARLESAYAARVETCWLDSHFPGQYLAWALAHLEAQRRYHQRQAWRSEALMRRMHQLNAWLFGLTLAAALAHLVLHSPWLSFATIFFPALGASLHGALAQTESYRLAAASRRVAAGLSEAMADIAACRAAGTPAEARRAIEAALVMIVDEHRDWHGAVRPHRLPLA